MSTPSRAEPILQPADPHGGQPVRKGLLTIAIEDYFQVGAFSALIPSAHWDRFDSRLMSSTAVVLRLLAETGNHATFFTCGWIADHHPHVLREVVAAGHEIACQGYFQHSVLEISPAAFALDLRRSRQAVEQATGQAVHGHRIGRRWLRPRDLWVLELIAEAGFAYDSSICPAGRDYANRRDCETVHRYPLDRGRLHEVPISSHRLAGIHVPIAGGNWFRQAPDWPLRRAADHWLRTRAEPLVAYFHTWEFDPLQPRIAGTGGLERVRHYRNLAGMSDRLRRWLTDYRFDAIASHLALAPSAVARAAHDVATVRDKPALTAVTQPTDAGAGAAAMASAAGIEITLVVPCFNEEAALPYLANTLRRFAATSGVGLTLSYVFIDDGSADATWALLQAQFAGLSRCALLRHPHNRGIAAAILTGFAACKTDLIAVIDADCTFDPAQLPAMLEYMAEDVDVVAASPGHSAGSMRNVPAWRWLLSHGAAALYRGVLHHRLTSYTSCFRVYRRHAVAGLALSNAGFSGVAEILGRLDLAGKRIVEFPAVLETRVLGQSKIRVLATVGDHIVLLARLAACRWLGRPLPTTVGAMRAD